MSTPGTHFGYVYNGRATIDAGSGTFDVSAGMYFSVPGPAVIRGEGEGFAVTREGYTGLFAMGGPVEERGRLRYIDGCSDTLLLSPVMWGDPCFNLLHLPPGIDQTRHTHPSVRVGLIISGRGHCLTPSGRVDLVPGFLFTLYENAEHSFHTTDSSLRIVVYHPDSDFGPTHDDHPMVNRTYVEGESAAGIEAIRTR